MRAARTSLLLVAFALLASALHLTLALPAEIAASEAAAAPAAEEAASETVSQRDPEEHHPAPAAPAFHLPRPSEIIHAVGSYVHGAHQQHAQEHHEEVHEQVAEHHEQHHEQHEHHHPTTHRPHHRPPHRPLHPEKEKIKVTKTVLVEFTKLVTRHPVCMKVYGVKPPCLPFQAYSASGAHQPGKPCHHGGIRENDAPAGAFDDEEEGVYADAELKEGLYISPSAVAEMPAATNIVEAPEDLEAAARSARYLELRAPAVPAAPAAPAPVAAPASATPALPVEQSGRQHLIAAAASAASSAADNAAAGVGGLLGHRKPEKIVEYKTLWVTKVEKVWDHRVTATLVAENCVPTDLKIPFCGAGYGPTFEGGDEIVYKPVKPAHKPIHKPVHKPVHHEPVHKPVHHEPVHKPVHHEPVHKPVHHEPVHKPVHHEPVHKPVHHEPEHKPVHHEPVHKPVHHEPVHKPVHHEPVHKPVHHEPVHKPVHHEPVHKPAYKPEVEKPGYVEYSETEVPVDHHWKEGEDEVPAQEEAVAQASVENEAEEKPAFD